MLFFDAYLIGVQFIYISLGHWAKAAEIVEGKRSLRGRLLRSMSGGRELTSDYIISETFLLEFKEQGLADILWVVPRLYNGQFTGLRSRPPY